MRDSGTAVAFKEGMGQNYSDFYEYERNNLQSDTEEARRMWLQAKRCCLYAGTQELLSSLLLRERSDHARFKEFDETVLLSEHHSRRYLL